MQQANLPTDTRTQNPIGCWVQTEDKDVTEDVDVTNKKVAIEDEDVNGDIAWEDYVEMLYI